MNDEDRPRYIGVVEYLLGGPSDDVIKVAIAPYAALYLLDRRNAQFAKWLNVLERSRTEQRKIAFSYELPDLHLTSVGLAEST